MKNVRKIRKADGTKVEMTYEELCKVLGFIAAIHFVEITRGGKIAFTCGKPDEVSALRSAVRAKGFVWYK